MTTLEQIAIALRKNVQELREAEEPLADHTEFLISGLPNSIAVTQVVATIEACLGRKCRPST